MATAAMTKTVTVELPNDSGPPTVLIVEKLNQQGELALGFELGRRLHKSYGPGGYMANIRAMLDWMQKEGLREAYLIAVREAVDKEGRKAIPEPEDVEVYRRTPDGLAVELWLRTRTTHPELGEALIRSQLNEVTAWRVSAEMIDALSGGDPKSGTAGAGEVVGG